jgi:hypothetical protein
VVADLNLRGGLGGVRVGGRREARMASQGTGDDFVGRGAELAMLHCALGDARAGRPAIVAVEGEPGIGKTQLLRRFAAEASDLEVLWASGDEAEISLDYGVAEQLWAGVPAGLGVDGQPLTAGAAAAGGFAAGAALLDVLGALQQRGTVAIVVDDLQWADLPSARALLFAVRRLRRDNILVLLASRTHSLARLGDSWSRLLDERARRIRLHGLTPPDLQPLARALLGLDLAPAARERLCEHTGGNPLYVRALLEELPASALADPSGPLPAPHSYSATVLTRVAQLSHPAQDLLAAASVVGVRSSLPVAAAAAAIGDPVSAFDEACAARLVTPAVRAGTGEITFAHRLSRQRSMATFRWGGAVSCIAPSPASWPARRPFPTGWRPPTVPMTSWPPSWRPWRTATSPPVSCLRPPSSCSPRPGSARTRRPARNAC